MDIYNASHKNDITAYLAIKNIEGKEPRKMTWPGLTYKIGEVVQLTWVCDKLVTQERAKIYKTLREAMMSGEATGYTLTQKEYEKYKDNIKSIGEQSCKMR